MTFKQKRFLAIMCVACPSIALGRLIVQDAGWEVLFLMMLTLSGVISFIGGLIWLLDKAGGKS